MKIFKTLALLVFVTNAFANPVAESHIKENLPETFEQFESILQKDLNAHFSNESGQNVTVKYELLRKQPTQSGVAYPKFYAWVVITSGASVISSGAIRLAAINGDHIEVTNYLTSSSINKKPESVDAVFPSALCNNIRKLAAESNGA